MRKYFEQNKYTIFPEIKDWTDPQDHLRNEKNVNKLSWSEWFFFHPSAYKLINYGSPTISSLIFGAGAWVSFAMGIKFIAILCLIFVLFMLIDLFKKLKLWKINKRTTFYDMWLREYMVEDLHKVK